MTAFKDERAFGRAVGAVVVGMAAFQFWRGRVTLGIAIGAVGLLLAVLGTVAPAALVVPNRLWRRVAHVLGWINIRILLSVFFFVVVTPIGLVLRWLGKDPLARRGRGSNWSPYGERVRDPRHFERMF